MVIFRPGRAASSFVSGEGEIGTNLPHFLKGCAAAFGRALRPYMRGVRRHGQQAGRDNGFQGNAGVPETHIP